MATNTWIGSFSTGGAWGSGGNWSGGVPISTSNINFNVGWTGDPTITTPNAAIAFQDMAGGDTSGGANQINITSGGASTIWTPGVGAFINTPLTNQLIQFQPGFAGSALIAKQGPGLLYTNPGTGTPAVTHTGGWDVQEGALAATASNRLGTGPVTLAAGTQYGNVGGSAITLPNNLTINGNVYLNAFPAWDTAARQALTISGSVTLPATTVTLNVGNTFASNVTLSGTITGTAGFTKAGAGSLYLTNTAGTNTISGTVTISNDIGVYLNSVASGPADQLKNISTFNFTTQNAFLAYQGGTAFTQNSSFTNSVAGYGVVCSYNAGGITLNDASVGTFTGGFVLRADGTFTASKFSFGVFPANATLISLESYASGATAVTNTATFAHTAGGTTSNPITIVTGTASATGHTAILEDNGSVPSSFAGSVTKTGAASTSATLRLTGTNISSTISGAITNSVGTLALNKQGTGRWILSGANTYTGATTIVTSGGTLVAANNSALGDAASTQAVTVNTGGTLEIAASSVAKGSASLSIGGTGDGGNGAVRSQSGTNTYTAASYVLTAVTTRLRADAGRLTLASAGAISSGASVFGIEKTGAGEVELPQLNSSYLGATTITTGKLVVKKLANVGAVSSIGSPALANATVTFAPGTTLTHEGTTADTTDRIFALNATGTLTVESSGTGSGSVTLSSGGTFSWPAGTNTLALAGINSADNTCARPVTGTTNLVKSGSNKWVLTNTLILNSTTVSGGTLNLGSQNRNSLGPVSISSGVLENGINTIQTSSGVTMTGGTITAEITSTTTLTVNSGTTARLAPTNNKNSNTGAAAINTGAVLEVVTQVDPSVSGAGKVLGDSNVTVAGTLMTSANVNQRGQMRYGGDLTFNAGAVLKIGFAA